MRLAAPLPSAAKGPPLTKIGFYPSAFDPVHDVHLGFARAAIAMYGLDKLYFLPEPIPRHTQGVKALEHRINMLHLVLANEPKMGILQLETQDFDIKSIYPKIQSRFFGEELYMLFSTSPITRLSRWPHLPEFITGAPHFITGAPQQKLAAVKESTATLISTKKLDVDIDVIAIDDEIKQPLLRRSLKQGERPAGIPQVVYEYIKRNKLYGS